MKEKFISEVMSFIGSKMTYVELQDVRNAITLALSNYTLSPACTDIAVPQSESRFKLLQIFLVTKKIEGCTERTLNYYGSEIRRLANAVQKNWEDVTSDDIRLYIAQRAIVNNNSKATQDNVLRILRSFFGWLTTEEHIPKNPTMKIKKIKQERRIKKPFTEIEIEKLRNGARDIKERAIIDLLLSTGMRVGEITGLNKRDIEGDQCIVYGKGEKERYVYLNAKAIVSIDEYLKTRTDSNEALFVSDQKPHKRLKISGFEIRLRELGRQLGIDDVHPHRFRRTAATFALNRGMPIEQVQKMLGHEQIATTLIYAQSAQENVKAAHKKFLA